MALKHRSTSAFLAAGVALPIALLAFGGSSLYAQQPPRPAPKATPAPKGTAPTTNTPPVHQRTETMVYDAWTVTCRENIGGGNSAKVCSALLALRLVEENRQQNLGSWILGRNNEGALVAVLQTAMFQTPNSSAGLLISKGIELKLGTAAVRRLIYSACEPQRCEASIPMDDAMVKEAVAAANATITVYARDGTALNINVPSIKGIDKAVAALGK